MKKQLVTLLISVLMGVFAYRRRRHLASQMRAEWVWHLVERSMPGGPW